MFAAVDKQLKLVGTLQNGCTCCFMMLEKQMSGETTMTVAHVGDSRVVLMNSGKAIRVTRDHKGSDPGE